MATKKNDLVQEQLNDLFGCFPWEEGYYTSEIKEIDDSTALLTAGLVHDEDVTIGNKDVKRLAWLLRNYRQLLTDVCSLAPNEKRLA